MSEDEIIEVANQAGWQVADLNDGFGERLKRFVQLWNSRAPLQQPAQKQEGE